MGRPMFGRQPRFGRRRRYSLLADHEFPEEIAEKLEDIYLNLSKDLLGALRRRLPVTKQKFDWERAGTGGVAKLGKNLQEMAAK